MNRDNYVTILAIYDDPPPPSTSSPTIISVDKSSHHRRQPDADGVVEITNFNEPPSHGLKVISEPSTNCNSGGRISPFYHHRSEHSSSTAASFRRSPTSESFQKPFQSNSSGSSLRQKDTNNMASNLSRTQARKSRFTEAFLDARERLEENMEQNEIHSPIPISNISDPNLRQMKVTLLSETLNIPLGIEISAVPDLSDNRKTRILAVEIRKIDEDGRVAIDGRIKVGDQITDINHRPVYQMSLPAAQARLHELQFVEEPLLVVTRRTGDDINDSTPKTLKTTALQQANTTKTGEILSVSIKKSSTGFGFGVKSRVNTRSETLICINSVSINGPAYNKLQIGDRLLKINDTEVITFSQADVVAMLKKARVGSTITFSISRMSNDYEQPFESGSQHQPTSSAPTKSSPESLEMVHKRRQSAFVDILDENVEFLTFDVRLINSRSAGLGISLKGGKLYPENGTLESGIDCGLFVKGILHGSAAFHDGRFRENDRLIGIENLDLREYMHNADALAAFTNTLGNVPIQQNSVKVHIARCKDYPALDFGRKPSTIRKDIPPHKATAASVDGYESEVSLAPDSDAFNRKNPIRKSISEKHPFGAKDAIHAQAYQKILHQRQTSAPQFPSSSESPTIISNDFKRRRTSLTHRLPLSLASQPIDMELSPNENKAPTSGDDYWAALNKLQISKKRQSMFIESSLGEKPTKVQSLKSSKEQSTSKLAPLSQLFQHLKGSKKDKSRRHTIYVAPNKSNNDVVIEPIKPLVNNTEVEEDDGLKPRSLSHEPLSSKEQLKSKEDAMIHEVIAGTKSGTLQPSNVLRRKKIEPAPSFKMAMSNSQPAFGAVNSDQNVIHDFQPELLRDKNKRKSTGGFFRFLRGGENSSQKHSSNDDYEGVPRLPPPYNAPHRPAPPAVPPHGNQAYRYPKTVAGPPISHHRVHSAQESTSNHDVYLVSNSSTLPSKRINYQDPTNIGACLNQKPYTITKSIAMMDPVKQPTTSRPRLTSSNTQTTWPIEPQMPTTSSIRPRLTSAPPPINSNNSAFINDNFFTNNNVKERYKISNPHTIEETGITIWDQQGRPMQPTTTATITTPSTPGSPRQPGPWGDDISPKGNLPLWLATSTVTKHRAHIPSPPPLMPRNCNAPAIPQRIQHHPKNSQATITSMPLHRVPSPSSPLHILTPTTPPMMQQVHTDFEPSNPSQQHNRRMSLRFRKQRSEPPPEPTSKTPPLENKKFLFSWARSSKTSFQPTPDPRSRRSVRALKTPSATFYYDKDEAPVKC